jgi:hypothetical protein
MSSQNRAFQNDHPFSAGSTRASCHRPTCGRRAEEAQQQRLNAVRVSQQERLNASAPGRNEKKKEFLSAIGPWPCPFFLVPNKHFCN